MKTNPWARIAASLVVLCLSRNGTPSVLRLANSNRCGGQSNLFMEQALALRFGSESAAAEPAHVRITQGAAAAREVTVPVPKAPPTDPADVRRVVYVAGGSEVLKPEFFTRLIQTFSHSKLVISLDEAYTIEHPPGRKIARMMWMPKNDPFEPVVLGPVTPIPAEEVGLDLETIQTVFRQETARHRNHFWQMVYVPSLYEGLRDLRPMPDGPTAIVVRSPGTSGQLARSVDLYVRLLKVLQPGDFLYVDDSYLPLRLLPAEKLGLEEVQAPILARLVPQPESVISLGVTLYRKTSNLPEESIRQVYELDSALYSDLGWYKREWDPVPFMRACQDFRGELTSSERSALLGRLDRLLENSALPAWARQQRREAFRDFLAQQAKSTVVRRSVAKPLMGLLAKVRELSRRAGAGTGPPADTSVLSRLSQLRFSIEEIQSSLIAIDRLPGTAAQMYARVKTQRKLLAHYARNYRILRKAILDPPPSPDQPGRSSIRVAP